jgi:hypothetical protein
MVLTGANPRDVGASHAYQITMREGSSSNTALFICFKKVKKIKVVRNITFLCVIICIVRSVLNWCLTPVKLNVCIGLEPIVLELC